MCSSAFRLFSPAAMNTIRSELLMTGNVNVIRSAGGTGDMDAAVNAERSRSDGDPGNSEAV